MYQNICSALFGYVTKHGCNRQTDIRTELRLSSCLQRKCMKPHITANVYTWSYIALSKMDIDIEV